MWGHPNLFAFVLPKDSYRKKGILNAERTAPVSMKVKPQEGNWHPSSLKAGRRGEEEGTGTSDAGTISSDFLDDQMRQGFYSIPQIKKLGPREVWKLAQESVENQD